MKYVKYSIDTSALLDGWIRYYPPDVFPGLWSQLDELVRGGDLRATEEVLHELEKKHDEVYDWVRQRAEMFVPLDERIQVAVTDILQRHEKLLDTRANRSGADPFVIALARVEKGAVVTAEKPTNSPKRPNIPDVCRDYGIACINMLQLIRQEGWIFHN